MKMNLSCVRTETITPESSRLADQSPRSGLTTLDFGQPTLTKIDLLLGDGFLNYTLILSPFVISLKIIFENKSPFCGATDTLLLEYWSALGFRARVDCLRLRAFSPICVQACYHFLFESAN